MMVKRVTGTLVLVMRFDPMENHVDSARVAGNVGVFVGSPEMVDKMIEQSLAGLADDPKFKLRPQYQGWDKEWYPQVIRKEIPVWISADFEPEAEMEDG